MIRPTTITSALLPAIVLCGLVQPAAGADDTRPYEQKSTWFLTMLAARDGLAQADSSADGLLYAGPIIQGGQPAQHVKIPVAGVKELVLYVSGAPEVVYAAATWGDARLVDADGDATNVSTMKSLQVVRGRHSIDCNMESGVSGPLAIAGQPFERGIHVYAESKVRITLDKEYETFEAWIGIDDWIGDHGAVRFFVADPRGAARIDLWEQLALDFPEEAPRREMKWERQDRVLEDDWTPGAYMIPAMRYAEAAYRIPPLAKQAKLQALTVGDVPSLQRVRQLYLRSRELDEAIARARSLDFYALRLAIVDLTRTYNDRYPQGKTYFKRLGVIENAITTALARTTGDDLARYERVEKLLADFELLRTESLAANPLLEDLKYLLCIRRVPHGDPRRPHGRGYGVGEYIGTPRQSSKCNPGIEQPFAWENEISVLTPVGPKGRLKTLYQPEGGRLVTDVDLDFDAQTILFSMPGSHDKWQVFEQSLSDRSVRQLTPDDQPDVHNYDSCYLPDGRIAFVSTAPLQGVPCNTGVIVGMMYMMDADGKNVRQVCFEQDHTYGPTVLNDGRVMYLRWDYTDTPHVWNRMLFAMNPDGSGQMEHYGSNSYWPNSIFHTRPIPQHPTKFVAIVTGHHVGRVGELTIFDPALGRQEADGVVQRIPGRGKKVEPLIEDKLTEHSWPKFIHPYPLSEKYFLVSCKPTPDSLWGIYLVDVFDNMLLIKEEERHALLEPIPLRKTARPPVIPSRIKSDRDDATIYLADVYAGPGLAGIPRGTVKSLRVFTYHFGYQKQAGITHRVGADGPWEIKRVLGTVPVAADGSALFRVPAKTPLSVQPLDAEGKAVALMRSWMTAQPGETLSCVGCHENRGSTPPPYQAMNASRTPDEIEPWYGSVRGFSFDREVQPVLDRFCVACHDGSDREDGQMIANLRGDQESHVVFRGGDPEAIRSEKPVEELIGKYNAIFPPSYIELRRFVRTGGLESDLHLLPPMEFHADTNELVQMLQKGHHGVKLDREAWDRLITWIDLNTPCHGTWSQFTRIPGDQRERRQALRQLYQGVDQDHEEFVALELPPIEPIMPEAVESAPVDPVVCDDWPLSAEQAAARQSAVDPVAITVALGDGLVMKLVRIPAGRFVLGDANGQVDEQAQSVVTFDKPYWMSTFEVTNRQYAQFDPTHESRFEHRTSWIFSEDYLGWPLDGPDQPVVRVSQRRATEFCQWLTDVTGMAFSLPTEEQWEYACRAGSDQPLNYGDLDTDFSPHANMADWSMRELAYEAWRPKPPDIVARDARFDDGYLVTADVGSYRPNAWGLYDMHGNVAEWTRSVSGVDDGRRVVRGGSWHDRPKRCRSSFRLSYPPYQRVYDVGFRVVHE